MGGRPQPKVARSIDVAPKQRRSDHEAPLQGLARHAARLRAAFTRFGFIGMLRSRTPTASNTALPIAGAIGLHDGSPEPVARRSGRSIEITLTVGASVKRMIG